MASILDLYPESQVTPGRDASLPEQGELSPPPGRMRGRSVETPPALDLYQGTDPDKNARKLQQGLPVDADDEVSERYSLKKKRDAALADAPRTVEWMRRPNNAAVSHDAIEELSHLEVGLRNAAAGSRDLLAGAIGALGVPFATRSMEAEWIEQLRSGDTPEGVTVDDVLREPLSNVLPFLLEQGIASIPHVIGSTLFLPAYMPSFTEQLAQERAENDGRLASEATLGDWLSVAPAGIGGAVLERFGARGFLGLDDALKAGGWKNVAKAAGKALVKEGATEAVQESMENVATTAGTERGFSLSETVKAAFGGAIAGAGIGASVRTVTATGENILMARRANVERENMKRLEQQLKASTLFKRDPKIAADHIAKIMEEHGNSMWVNGAVLREWLSVDPNHPLHAELEEQLAEAEVLGVDVRLTNEQFAQHLLISDRFGDIADHIKRTSEAMTKAEADEYASSGLQEDIDALDREVAAAYIKAFHGTPYRFDRFDHSKIGTGEGAQAFGFGLYFAEAEAVARGYQQRLSGVSRVYRMAGRAFKRDEMEDYIASNMTGGNTDALNRQIASELLFDLSSDQPWGMDRFQQHIDNTDLSPEEKARYAEGIAAARDIQVEREEGFMYTVELQVDPERLLDFDLPMTEQSQFVQDAYKKATGYLPGSARNGKGVYDDLTDDFSEASGPAYDWWVENGRVPYRKASEVVSRFLFAHGIQGNRYLDADSRQPEAKVTMDGDPGELGNAALKWVRTHGGVEEAIEALNRDADFPPEEAEWLEEFGHLVKVEPAESTRNIVVYDDSLVSVTHINGEPVPRPEVPVEMEGSAANSLDIAEEEMGLQALFQTADEAGMSEAKYASYLATIEKARQAKANKAALLEKKREERANNDEMMLRRAEEKEKIRESLSNDPLYQAFNNIAAVRLDRKQVEAAMNDMGRPLSDLPKQAGNRQIFANAEGEPGQDLDMYAQAHGFANGMQMLHAFMANDTFAQAIDKRLEKVMHEKYGHLFTKQREIEDAKRELMTDHSAAVLDLELNALRVATGEKRISAKLLKLAAKLRLGKTQVGDINPNRYLKQAAIHAKEAGKLLRKGDLEGAKKAKFQQVLNHRMAQESYRQQERTEANRKFLAQFLRNRKKHHKFKASYLVAIRELLENVGLEKARAKREPNPVSREQAAKRFEERGGPTSPVAVPSDLLKGPFKFQNMELAKFEELVAIVRELHHAALHEAKLRKDHENRDRDLAVAFIADAVKKNLSDKSRGELVQQNWFEKLKAHGTKYALMLFHMDTLVSEIDGHSDTNTVAYDYLKKPYDDAMTKGYREGQVGFVQRSDEVTRRLISIYKAYTKKEWGDLNKTIEVPGVDRPISRNTVLSVLLHSGNDSNIAALLESGTVTEAEIRAIHAVADKRDWDFAQSIWDMLEEFWPEIVEAEERRRGRPVEKVKAVQIDTPFGTYRGGYFPISRDKNTGPSFDPSEVDNIFDDVRFGNHVSSHTAHGHTEARTRDKDHKVKLDLGVLENHLNRLVYDLEMGDAVHDIHKVLMHRDLQKAFAASGQKHRWEQMQLWLRDAITHEIGLDNTVEKALRTMRTGFAVSKIGLNIGVALKQFLGVTNTAALLGKKNMLKGVHALFRDRDMVSKVNELSPFMKHRMGTFHKEIMDARRGARPTWFDRMMPGDTAEPVRQLLFLLVKKAQRQVDVVTWIAAMHHGMELNKGDQAEAIKYADRMVRNTQGSGIFGDRSAVERGTTSTSRQQLEWVRAFTALINYFVTRNNIVHRRYQKFKKDKSVAGALNMGVDFALMFVFEALVIGAVNEAVEAIFHEDDGEESEFWSNLAGDVAAGTVAGFPLVREAASAMRGFPAGGVSSSVLGDLGRAGQQTLQGEIDEEFLKSWNNVLGVWLRYPAGQLNKVISTAGEEEVEDPFDWLFGPDYRR